MFRLARPRRAAPPTLDPDPSSPASLAILLAAVREARFHDGLRCPRCLARHPIQRWGSFRGRQRYRCFRCSRTFSDLTATPAAYSKKLGLWVPYARCLQLSLSVRRAARSTGIHPCTAFRWRHKLLHAHLVRDRDAIAGWIELSVLLFPYSEKGRRPLDRAPHRHGVRPHLHPITVRARGTPLVPVLIACDRLGHLVSTVLPPPWTGPIHGHHLHAALDHRIGTAPTLLAQLGRLSPFAAFARRHHGRFHDARLARLADPRTRSLVHVRTTRDYTHRLIAWLEPFRGVATRYLPHYLIWHRTLDQAFRNPFAAVVLRWPFPVPE